LSLVDRVGNERFRTDTISRNDYNVACVQCVGKSFLPQQNPSDEQSRLLFRFKEVSDDLIVFSSDAFRIRTDRTTPGRINAVCDAFVGSVRTRKREGQ